MQSDNTPIKSFQFTKIVWVNAITKECFEVFWEEEYLAKMERDGRKVSEMSETKKIFAINDLSAAIEKIKEVS